MEIDGFDALDPTYVVVVSNYGRLFASLRILPTTGPHMLADVFHETMGDAAVIRNPAIWESSRFCVDTEAVRAFGRDGVNEATRLLLLGLFETALERGCLAVVSVFDVAVERILKRVGCQFERLGPELVLDRGLRTVAARFSVNKDVIAALCQGVPARSHVRAA